MRDTQRNASPSGVAVTIFDRLKIRLVSILGYWVICIVCRTLRWKFADSRTLDSVRGTGSGVILAFWHGRILAATYCFRNRGIVVMTSQNRDGEYIARVIRRFGYGVARGSSTRGSRGATAEIFRALKNGKDVGLTMDGPRGPRYIAKKGAAFIARKSGSPVLPFNISVEKKWVMRSWDHFQIPKPFSRVVVLIGDPIYVDKGSTGQQMQFCEAQIQQSLDELRDRGDSWWTPQTNR